jgi:hypothetical protein
VVRDASGTTWANRKVVVSVSRAGEELYELPDQTTGPNGEVDVDGDIDGIPSGALTITATLYDVAGTASRQTVTTDVVAQGLVLTPSPEFLEARAGSAYPSFTVTVSDDRGPVVGVPVDFSLPPGSPGATYASGPDTTSPTTASVVTNASGVAVAPAMTAKSATGSFNLTVTSSGATSLLVPMATQYGIGSFVSPVASSTTTNSSGTTPVKVAVLGLNGQPVSDAAAAALLSSGQIQIRFQRILPNPPAAGWTAVPGSLIAYDAKKDFFQADLKASSLGWTKPNTYRVEFRVLATGLVPTPGVGSSFDLGGSFFDVTVTK